MNVSEMTPEQVRREIAERLGYTVGWLPGDDEDGGAYVLYDPDGEVCSGPARDSVDDLWRAVLADDTHNDAIIPDWTRDTSAALDLCLECLRRKHRDNHVPPYIWTLEFCAGGVVIKRTSSAGDIVEHSARGWDALALARLALEALRAQEGRGVSA